MTTTTTTNARHQAILRTVDKICHYFRANKIHGPWGPNHVQRYEVPRGHAYVRVYLLRRTGWTYAKIAKVYGIPVRTAMRSEANRWGKTLIDDAVRSGNLEFKQVISDLLVNI